MVAPRDGWDLEPVTGPGGEGSDLEEVSDGVTVALTDGGAVFLPRSMRSLRGEALEAARRVQAAALEVHDAQQVLEEAVREARELGVAWSAIGWSVGTSGEAARQRWGDRGDPD